MDSALQLVLTVAQACGDSEWLCKPGLLVVLRSAVQWVLSPEGGGKMLLVLGVQYMEIGNF